MLLQTLRRSRSLARLVLAWFVFAMGLAVAATAVQPLTLGSICSAAASGDGANAPDGTAAAGVHHGLQCVLCLATGAPPSALVATLHGFQGSSAPDAVRNQKLVLAMRQSPLAARAPPVHV
jgi:hypothetical protein